MYCHCILMKCIQLYILLFPCFVRYPSPMLLATITIIRLLLYLKLCSDKINILRARCNFSTCSAPSMYTSKCWTGELCHFPHKLNYFFEGLSAIGLDSFIANSFSISFAG